MNVSDSPQIISYDPAYKSDFKRLNVEWLEKYFVVEGIDEQMLSDPESYIINKGGFIFFALYNQEVIGTAALIKESDEVFELSKMSVTEKHQGLGVGRLLAERALQAFEQTGAKLLFLESNAKLEPALRLYESLGFKHTDKTSDSHYQRADVYMTYQPTKD